MKQPPEPPRRAATTREAIREALLVTRDTGATATARELATAASISEMDVVEHLEHLAYSLRREGFRLDVHPAECLACGFVFGERERLTTPSACPKCRSERVSPPTFRVQGASGSKRPKRIRAPREEDGGTGGGDGESGA
jgi:predicted Zn-ribbon and HTH transcriptional regulator